MESQLIHDRDLIKEEPEALSENFSPRNYNRPSNNGINDIPEESKSGSQITTRRKCPDETQQLLEKKLTIPAPGGELLLLDNE